MEEYRTRLCLLEVRILDRLGLIAAVIGNLSIIQAELVADDIDCCGLDVIDQERRSKFNTIAIGLKTKISIWRIITREQSYLIYSQRAVEPVDGRRF